MNAILRKTVFVLGLSLCASLAARVSHAALSEFYVGVDGLTTIGGVGTYAGLPNPNFGRLTLLYNHGDHYHGIGTYAYTGPNMGAGTAVVDTSANNRLPEISAAQPPLLLTGGAGVYAGKLVSQPQIGVEYSNLEMLSVHSLDGNPEDTMGLFGSSSGRWDDPLWDANQAADIHLELVSVTPGLNVGTLANPLALSVGLNEHVGEGDELFSFTPVLWTEGNAAVGTYSAEFRLSDEAGVLGNSGRFFVDVQVVPEPTSAIVSLIGALGLIGFGRRRA
jgi:hypothetical protein